MKEINGWEIISTYTTRQAVEDGFLVKVDSRASEEAGIKFPVYLTRSAWDRYAEIPVGMEGEQDVSGRLWDILFMFAMAASRTSGNILFYELICRMPENDPIEPGEKYVPGECRHQRLIRLKAVIGPQDIDDPSPAIFIMKPSED